MIPQSNISLISNTLMTAGARRIPRSRHRARLRAGLVSDRPGWPSTARRAGFQRGHGPAALLVRGLSVFGGPGLHADPSDHLKKFWRG